MPASGPCPIMGCTRPQFMRGLCDSHYRKALKGTVEFPRPAMNDIRNAEPYPEGVKSCSCCNETKTLDQYTRRSKDPASKLVNSICRKCAAEKQAEQRKSNPTKMRDRALRSWFNIGLEDYDRMYADQGGVCKTCGQPSTNNLDVDHDRTCCAGRYSCGKCIRGLLCRPCNQVLGMVKDDPRILKNMLDYLEQNR